MGVPVRDYLKRRRNRAMGSIMGYAERELFASLSDTQRERFRQTIVDSLNGYHDSVLDLISAETDVVRNDRLIDLLETLEQRTRRTPVHSAP